jgi:L-asparaginase II
MAAFHGHVLVKVGADGIYCAALPGSGLGVAIKVEDGDMRTSPVALLGLLQRLAPRVPLTFEVASLPAAVARHAELKTHNTRGVETGATRAAGELRFSDL